MAFLSFTEARAMGAARWTSGPKAEALDYAVQAYAFGPLEQAPLDFALRAAAGAGCPHPPSDHRHASGMEAKAESTALQGPDGSSPHALYPQGMEARRCLAAPIQLAAGPGAGMPP